MLILDREELSAEITEADDCVPRELHAEEKRPHAQGNHSGFVDNDDEAFRAGVSVQLVKQSLPFDILRGDVRKGDAVHTALLERFAFFVWHHVDKALRFEFFDEQLDEV